MKRCSPPTQAMGLLSLMLFLAPAVAVPYEEMLQDTLKSMVVAFLTLGAAGAFFWRARTCSTLRWHWVLSLPLLLMVYALGSMAWSHTYLAGVETVRWFLFFLLAWLALQGMQHRQVHHLALAVHGGAMVAAIWGAWQFWLGFDGIPQGPNPASTFVNRNFAAEFMVIALPYSAYLLLRARTQAQTVWFAAALAFQAVFLMMLGTRSALLAACCLGLVWVLATTVFYRTWGLLRWTKFRMGWALGAGLLVFVGLGLIPSRNPAPELMGLNALERGWSRMVSISGQDNSFNVRRLMWQDTLHMAQQHPWKGVGAGAWEVQIPLYQRPGSQLETDYYAHNEYLQLWAEYGVVGWLFLLPLLAYVIYSACLTWTRRRTPAWQREALIRSLALTSLMALLIVSLAGFPWRMATSGALFAMALGVLMASDFRLHHAGFEIPWGWRYSIASMLAIVVSALSALLIAYSAARCEFKIVRAIKIAMGIAQSSDPQDPAWAPLKQELLGLAEEGIAINPHYRKLTPLVADELARMGDWANALWIWESVVASRPYVVAIWCNITHSYLELGRYAQAANALQQARRIQPNAPAVRTLEIIYASRRGHNNQAMALARRYLQDAYLDLNLLDAIATLAAYQHDWAMALEALKSKVVLAPEEASDIWLQIADIYYKELQNTPMALLAYQTAYKNAALDKQDLVRQHIPVPFLENDLFHALP